MRYLTTFIGFVAVALAIWFPFAAWLPLALATAFLALTASSIGARVFEADTPQALSPLALELLKRYGYFYTRIMGSMDFWLASNRLGYAAIVVAIIDAIEGFYWGLVGGVLLFIVNLRLGKFFSPTHFFSPAELAASRELMEHFRAGGTVRRVA